MNSPNYADVSHLQSQWFSVVFLNLGQRFIISSITDVIPVIIIFYYITYAMLCHYVTLIIVIVSVYQ